MGFRLLMLLQGMHSQCVAVIHSNKLLNILPPLKELLDLLNGSLPKQFKEVSGCLVSALSQQHARHSERHRVIALHPAAVPSRCLLTPLPQPQGSHLNEAGLAQCSYPKLD